MATSRKMGVAVENHKETGVAVEGHCFLWNTFVLRILSFLYYFYCSFFFGGVCEEFGICHCGTTIFAIFRIQ